MKIIIFKLFLRLSAFIKEPSGLMNLAPVVENSANYGSTQLCGFGLEFV